MESKREPSKANFDAESQGQASSLAHSNSVPTHGHSEVESQNSANNQNQHSTSEEEVPLGIESMDDENERFWSALDKHSERFWEAYCKNVEELKSSKDFHSAIVTGPDNFKLTIESDHAHGPLDQLSYEFIRKIRERDKKLCYTIQHLRDRCEDLELNIQHVKEAVIKAGIKAKKDVNEVRRFWRNEISEGQSRSGRLLKAALNSFK